MPLNNKRLLIIGSDGFVGRNLRDYCDQRGFAYHTIARKDGDLSDWPTVEQLFKSCPPVDRIFHLVTRQRTGQIQYKIQGELLAINARIHLNVLEAWRRHQPQAKLVSTGSSCAYPEAGHPLTEDEFGTGAVHPSVLGYAQAKLVLARGSAAYASQYGLKYLHCILATLYGPFDHKEPDRSHFFGAMLTRAIEERAAGAPHFTVWGNRKTVRELLYVEDQIEAILAADDAFENRILNCAANAPITVGEAATAILRALDWNVPTFSPPSSFQGADYKVLDSSVFLKATGYRPKFDLRAGIRALLQAEGGESRSHV
ncbi:MAG: NAD-dependent epimerase/dehydratase family protein [Alphaproteobacteria bacterium]